MPQELAKAIFARHSTKQREAEWQRYLKFTEGASRMGKRQWYRFNYNAEPPEFKTKRMTEVESGLRTAGLTEAEIRKLRGK